MGTGYKNRGSGAAGLGFKNRGAKLVEGAAYTNRGATDGVNEAFKNRGQSWGSDAYYNRGPNDFASLSVLGLAEFYAPLTHSLTLTRGTGDPTYSRATNAWEFDNEGKLILVPGAAGGGSARFGGARMVRNLWVYSETPTNAYWEVLGGAVKTTGETDPFGGTNAAKITINGGRFDNSTAMGISAYSTVTMSCWAKANAAGNVGCGYSGFTPAPSLAVTTEWQRVQTTFTVGSSSVQFVYPVHVTGTDVGITDVWLYGIQVEVVTGQADQTASEYIPTGVLSAPYHGAGVDGVKWFATNKDGSTISESSLLGYHPEGAGTNSLLYSRDLTNAAWVKTNVTAVKTATGIDNAPNSASTLTASAADATILQTISLAAAARSFSAYVKRRTGSGSVYITRDGGTNWTDITSSLGASWTRVKIKNTSVLNPSVGFKIATSGDAIDVDVCQDEAGASISSPIITTTAAVTRNADAETFQTASNWSDTAGWALATVQGESWANATGTAIGNGTNGLKLSASNSGIVAYDGTNTVNGPAGSPSGAEKLAMTWGSGALQAASGGVAGSAGSYDGAWGLATVGIGTSQGNVYIKDVYIGQSALTAAQLVQVTA